MNLQDAETLLSLRNARERRAAFAAAEARKSAKQSAAQAQAARAALVAAKDHERHRKLDAYRALSGHRISGSDLRLHSRKMDVLEKETQEKRDELGAAKTQLEASHEKVAAQQAVLRSRLRDAAKWQHLADDLRERCKGEAALLQSLQDDDDASEFFVLSRLMSGGVS